MQDKTMSYIRITRALVCACALAVFASACTKTQYKTTIGFKVSGVNTKALVATKSTPATTDNIKDVYGQFTCDVWVGDDETSKTTQAANYIPNGLVKYSSTSTTGYNWNFEDSENAILDYYWINDVYMSFWSFAPVTLSTGASRSISSRTNVEKGTLSFSYSLPTATADGTDAEKQQDLLFAYNWKKLADGSSDGTVNINFDHALSWIRFLINTTDGTFDNYLDIQDITLSGMPNGGTCIYKPTQSAIKDRYAWTPSTTTASYRQVVTKSEFATALGTKGYLSPESKAFMLIPCTTGSDATITITFKRTDGSTVARTASLSGEIWQPGYYYTYKINATSLDDPITFTVTYVDWEDGGTGNI